MRENRAHTNVEGSEPLFDFAWLKKLLLASLVKLFELSLNTLKFAQHNGSYEGRCWRQYARNSPGFSLDLSIVHALFSAESKAASWEGAIN